MRVDDHIIAKETRPIPEADPTKWRIPPEDTPQAEACNDFLPPAADTFDVGVIQTKSGFKEEIPTSLSSLAKEPIPGVKDTLGGVVPRKQTTKR